MKTNVKKQAAKTSVKNVNKMETKVPTAETIETENAETVETVETKTTEKKKSPVVLKKTEKGKVTRMITIDPELQATVEEVEKMEAALRPTSNIKRIIKNIKETKDETKKEKTSVSRSNAAVNSLGHRVGTEADKIDIILLSNIGKFVEVKKIAEEIKNNDGRVMLHIRHLDKVKHCKVEVKKENDVKMVSLISVPSSK